MVAEGERSPRAATPRRSILQACAAWGSPQTVDSGGFPIRAVILAAGEGARLRPLTQTLPKPMIRVANRPIVAYAVESLVSNGITDITIVVGYHREKLQRYFGAGEAWGARLRFVFQELLLGTGHALAQVDFRDDDVIVMGGDNLVDERIIRDLMAADDGLRMVVQRSKTPSKYGVVTLDKDRVARIEEKPREYQSETVNTGIYYFSRGFQANLDERIRRGLGGLSYVLEDLIREGRTVRAVASEGLWRDAVYPWDLLDINDALVRRQVGGAGGTETHAGKGTVLRPSTSVIGPALVGQGCVLESGVAIGPTTSIGDNVTIGANSVVENCILMDDVRIGPGSVIRNSIIAEGVTLGPRFTALAGPCESRAEDGWHALDDFGCVIGSDARLGGNVTVVPGVTIGAGANVGSGAWLRRNLGAGALVET